MRLPLAGNGIDDVQFVRTQPLLDESGNPFRDDDTANPPVDAPDAEAIAFDHVRGQIYWVSEGFAKKGANGATPVLANPWIRIAGLDGTYRGEFTLPPGSRTHRTGQADLDQTMRSKGSRSARTEGFCSLRRRHPWCRMVRRSTPTTAR